MRLLLLGSIALGLALVTTPSALAQDDDVRAQAREHFTTGVERYEAGDYQAALEQFQEAYRIAPHPSVRVNMANCYEQLNRPLEALHHYEGFLRETENPTPQQRREVRASIRRLRGQLGELRLNIAPDGALVTIDGAETRRAPVLEGIMLESGVHRIEVRMDGFETHHEELQIEGGETTRVSVRLERPSGGEAVASTEGQPDTGEETAAVDEGPGEETAQTGETSETSGEMAEAGTIDSEGGGGGWTFRLTAPVIIAGITTVVFAAAMITSGVLALDYNDQFEQAVARYNAATTAAARNMARQDGRSAADSANTASILTDVFLIGTIAAAGATIFFVIVEGLGGDEDTMAEREGDLALSGAVGPDAGAVTLLGRF